MPSFDRRELVAPCSRGGAGGQSEFTKIGRCANSKADAASRKGWSKVAVPIIELSLTSIRAHPCLRRVNLSMTKLHVKSGLQQYSRKAPSCSCHARRIEAGMADAALTLSSALRVCSGISKKSALSQTGCLVARPRAPRALRALESPDSANAFACAVAAYWSSGGGAVPERMQVWDIQA